MPALSTLVTFIVAVVVLAVTPGPDLLLLVSRGVGLGWRVALYTAIGFTVAGFVQLPLLAFGVAALVQRSPFAFAAVRYAGALYLIWRGIQLFRRRTREVAVRAGPVTPGGALRDGVVASLTNPKGLIFVLAFLPQFVDPGRGSVTVQLLILGVVMKVSALLVEGSIALASGAVGGYLARRPQLVRWQERVTGGVMIALGMRLLVARNVRAP